MPSVLSTEGIFILSETISKTKQQQLIIFVTQRRYKPILVI